MKEYEGNWKDGKEDGQGTYYSPNGKKKYEGDWKNGFFNDKGTYYWPNGKKQYGDW